MVTLHDRNSIYQGKNLWHPSNKKDHKGNLYIRGPCCAHYRNEMFEATYLEQWRIMTEGLWWSVRSERENHQNAWWCHVISHGVMLRHRQSATNSIFLKQKVQTVMQDPVWWFCSIGFIVFCIQPFPCHFFKCKHTSSFEVLCSVPLMPSYQRRDKVAVPSLLRGENGCLRHTAI